MRTLFPRSFVLVMVPLLFGACSKGVVNQTGPISASASQGSGITSENVVKFTAAPLEIAANGSAEATVHLAVQDGYHLNANPATYSYLKATELELSPPGGISVGFIVYPNAIFKKFPFAEKPIAIYEGLTQLKVLLKAAPSAPKGASNLTGKLKVQACDEQVCYPPDELPVVIPVTVK